MTEKAVFSFDKLTIGMAFPSHQFKLDRDTVIGYTKAVEDKGSYPDGALPPMFVAARVMSMLAEDLALPPGTIHISQEFAFMHKAYLDETLSSSANVSNKQSRGKLNIAAVDINVTNQTRDTILSGKCSFLFPV